MENGGGDRYDMEYVFSLFLSVAICFPLFVLITTTRVSSDHNSHTFWYFVFVFLKRYLFCCLWWVGLSFSLLHPLLQCLNTHLRSIRTCPNGIRGRWQQWDALSVLSLPLCGHAFRCGVFWIYDNSRFIGSQFSHVLDFVFCFGNVTFFCCLWWGGLYFLLLPLSCSVWIRICVQSGRVQMEDGGGDKYVSQ